MQGHLACAAWAWLLCCHPIPVPFGVVELNPGQHAAQPSKDAAPPEPNPLELVPGKCISFTNGSALEQHKV